MHSDDHSSSRVSTTRACVESLLAMVRLARALAEAGETIDLKGLDDQVGRLCARILDLPLADGRAMRNDLKTLQQETDALRASLDAQTYESP